MAKLLKVSETLFESAPCGRCGGCGNYSYCQMYGTTCFKCSGQGVLLTKRGRAAAAFYRELFLKPIGEVRVGMTVKDETPGQRRRFIVSKITGGSVNLRMRSQNDGSECNTQYGSPDMTIQVGGVTMPVSAVKPGDVVSYKLAFGKDEIGYKTVVSVHRMVRLHSASGFTMDVPEDGTAFVCPPAEQAEAFKAQALAYQATLTKTGKVAKKRAAATN